MRIHAHICNMSIRLFESAKHAQAYAKYRPTYGKNVADALIKFCQEGPNKLRVAIDVGCGSGQSTRILSKYFDQVIGIDVSPEQINQIKKEESSNISYIVSSGEELGFQGDNTTDLVTCAQSFHWLNHKVFYKEVDRVLRPGGSLVIYGYGNCTVDKSEVQKCIEKVYSEPLGPYWDDRRAYVETCYKEVDLGYPGWRRNDELVIERHMSVDALVGYVSSWSSYQGYTRKFPDNNILEDLKQRLQGIYHGDGEEDKGKDVIHVVWPVFILMGRKPTA